jgi:hypothetical protein
MMSTLKLVYPPVSNQEAEWVKSDPDVADLIRSSDFYLIGTRAEAVFDEVTVDVDYRVTIRISIGEDLTDEVVLDAKVFAQDLLGRVPETISVDLGPKVIRFYDGEMEGVDSGSAELFEWFTTEKLIHDRGREVAGISGFNRFREFATYELLYVGIAKATDTFARLFEGAHHARQRILSNEYPHHDGSRVTDEMVLFALRLEPLVFRTLEAGDAPTDVTYAEWEKHRKRVVIDAEKAFVHLLDPKYNVEKFAAYPRSEDGLWGSGYDCYGFVLIDNLTFTTNSVTFRGSGQPRWDTFDDHADMIITTGDVVELFVGLDRPGSE